MVRHAFEVLTGRQDPADLLLRRHGRAAQGAGQCAEPGDAWPAYRQAADRHPRSLRHDSELRCAQQCATARFLDLFGFDYEFISATEAYQAPAFSTRRLLKMLASTTRSWISSCRRWARSGARPIRRSCRSRDDRQGAAGADGRARRRGGHHHLCRPRQGERIETPVTGGHVQVPVEGRLGDALGGARRRLRDVRQGPDRLGELVVEDLPRARRHAAGGFIYELFLDENGEKISKSKGNGLTIEEWLTYAPPESLSLFMFQKPKTAKRLFFDVIPKAVDEYLAFLGHYRGEAPRRGWRTRSGTSMAASRPRPRCRSASLLLNLASASNARTRACCGASSGAMRRGDAETNPVLDRLAGYALAYFRDFVEPAKSSVPDR